MKILLTADLHLNIPARHRRTGRTNIEALAEETAAHRPDAVVVAGDIGVPERAPEYLAAVRMAVGNRPLAFCLGNHDHWIPPGQHDRFATLRSLREKCWEPSAAAVGAVLLDGGNAFWNEVTVCGGYGHFDLGHAEPGLCVAGRPVTRDDYLSGGMAGAVWNDFAFIPGCAVRLEVEARAQAAGIGKRLCAAGAERKPIVVVTHTCPWRELNAHPLRGSAADLFQAYSGNSLVGEILSRQASAVDLLVCGHTHRPVRETEIHGIRSLNIGADYGIFRGIVYDTQTRTIQWIGETI
jgi:predicted phosphodiesterase